MKKLISALMVLIMAFAVASCAMAEEESKTVLAGNVRFGMDREQVEQQADKLLNSKEKESEGPKKRGSIGFYELEYEDAATDYGFLADIKYFFVDNGLVAVHFDAADNTGYDAVREKLIQAYGEAVSFSAAKVGNGRYVIDDDGELDDCREMIEAEGVIIVLERDDDGGVDVTFLDPSASYLAV